MRSSYPGDRAEIPEGRDRYDVDVSVAPTTSTAASADPGRFAAPPVAEVQAYICDECVAVCTSIIADDQESPDDQRPSEDDQLNTGHSYRHPLLYHPLTSLLLQAVERWVIQESLGADAAEEFAEVHDTALQLFH